MRRSRRPIRASASSPARASTKRGLPRGTCGFVSNSPASEGFSGRGATGSDLAFTSHYAIQGNYRGFQIWDIATPAHAVARRRLPLPVEPGRSDDLRPPALHLGRSERLAQRLRHDQHHRHGEHGSLPRHPRRRHRRPRASEDRDEHPDVPWLAHEHARQDPRDKDKVYIYVSGYSQVRSSTELPSCISRPGRRFDERAVPHRDHSRAARASRAGEGRELAAPPRRSQRTHGACAAADRHGRA